MKTKKPKLTQKQKARIYCVKHGHAKYITMFFGEVYCGRCEEKTGGQKAIERVREILTKALLKKLEAI